MTTGRMESKAKIVTRNATIDDIPAIKELVKISYPGIGSYTEAHLRGQINAFPQGQFIVEINGKAAGYCATLRVKEAAALKAHTWAEITGGGYASTHDPEGDYLYGMEVCVSPDHRGMRIGNRLYRERKELCKRLRLKGIVFGGRMPLYKKRSQKVGSPENYVELVTQGKLKDNVITFQLRNGFQVLGVLPNYLPFDEDSMGFGTHMLWTNSDAEPARRCPKGTRAHQDVVRVAAVQYQQRKITSFEEFRDLCTYFVDVVGDYHTDIVLFPEYLTVQLLTLETAYMAPQDAVTKLTSYTDRVIDLFSGLAMRYNVNIIAGTHLHRDHQGRNRNTALVFLRDGSLKTQDKMHITQAEKDWWQVEGGNSNSAINTDCGPIGILIGYDIEFPEVARNLADQGADLLFVPFSTDIPRAYQRIRFCSHARTIENQCYVVLSGNVGNLPGVENMDIHYGESCILTPCDFQFPWNGVASTTTPNVETVAFGDLRLQDLVSSRMAGSSRNLMDRRHDLYQIRFQG